MGNKSIPWVNVVYRDEIDEWEEMNDQAIAFLLDGKFDDAEKLYQEICSKSENPSYFYDFTCVLSRKGNTEKALETIKTSLKFDKGNVFRGIAKTDSDFTNIRDLPTFQALIS